MSPFCLCPRGVLSGDRGLSKDITLLWEGLCPPFKGLATLYQGSLILICALDGYYDCFC